MPQTDTPLLILDDLSAPHPGLPGRWLFEGLNLHAGPGLQVVLGGDGAGKSTLLDLIAGLRPVQRGSVHAAGPVCHEQAGVPMEGDEASAAAGQVAADWLAGAAARHPGWDAALAARLVEAWRLDEHLPKPLYMLSAGSRRKLALLASAASRAPIVLLETPYAALDGRSRAVLDDLLADARDQREQLWLLADYEVPPGVPDAQVAFTLGDGPGA